MKIYLVVIFFGSYGSSSVEVELMDSMSTCRAVAAEIQSVSERYYQRLIHAKCLKVDEREGE